MGWGAGALSSAPFTAHLTPLVPKLLAKHVARTAARGVDVANGIVACAAARWRRGGWARERGAAWAASRAVWPAQLTRHCSAVRKQGDVRRMC
jgi:hypothetical protein